MEKPQTGSRRGDNADLCAMHNLGIRLLTSAATISFHALSRIHAVGQRFQPVPEAEEADAYLWRSTIEFAHQAVGEIVGVCRQAGSLSYECQRASRRSSTAWVQLSWRLGLVAACLVAGLMPTCAQVPEALNSSLIAPFFHPPSEFINQLGNYRSPKSTSNSFAEGAHPKSTSKHFVQGAQRC